MGFWGSVKPATRWLVAITVGWCVLQVVLLWPVGRYLTYDEAIYLSQVHADVPALRFTAPRARGVTWLLEPLAAFGPSVGVVRAYLVVLFGVLFFVAFRAWQPVLGNRVVPAAVLFGGCWVALFSGSELYPNLPVALGAVAATGFLARHLTAPRCEPPAWRPLWLAAGATAFVTLVRPIDGTLLAAALALAALSRQPKVLVIRWAALGGATLLAWVPWVVEAYVGYGGLMQRFADASDNVGRGRLEPLEIVRRHLELTAGREAEGVPVIGSLWWLVLAVGVLAAGWRGVRGRPELLAPAVAVVAFAAEYLLMTTVVMDRFLLPTYALAAICVAATVPALRPAWGRVAAAGVLAAFVGWNATVAVAVNDVEVVKRGERLALGKEVRDRAGGARCVLVAPGNFPEMAFAAGCYGAFLTSDGEARIPRDRQGDAVFMLTGRDPDRFGPGERWRVGDRWLLRPDGREFVHWEG